MHTRQQKEVLILVLLEHARRAWRGRHIYRQYWVLILVLLEHARRVGKAFHGGNGRRVVLILVLLEHARRVSVYLATRWVAMS